MNEQTPKHFVLQLGALMSLYLSISFLLALLFGLITIFLPDAADGYWEFENAASSVRIGIAMLIVFAPTYLVLTRLVNRARRENQSISYTGLTKWLLYLSLLFGAGALLIDLVVIIMAYLEGDMTLRFILKALAVLLVVGGAFYYYVMDVRGYWLSHEKESKMIGLGVLLIVLVSIVVGIMNIETPDEVRLQKIDNEIVGDLQDMQWRIEDFYRSSGSLPTSITELYGPFPAPTAPEGLSDYSYEVVSEKEYKMCAEFNRASTEGSESMARPVFEKNYNWEHQAGTWCFERIIDDVYRQ